MKVIYILILLLTSLEVVCQKKSSTVPKPSASEKKQMEETIKMMEETDPAAAKAMKEMLKQFDQQVSKPKASSTATVAKFVSPRTKILLKAPVNTPKASDTADRILWIKGKKINDSMLIAPSGAIILLQRKKNQVVIQPNVKKDPFEKMVRVLAQDQKSKEKMLKQIDSDPNAFFFFPAVLNTLREFDEAHDRYMELAKNVIDLKAKPDEFNVGESTGSGEEEAELKKQDNTPSKIPDSVIRMYNHVKDLIKNYPNLDFPDPPARELDGCFNCDSNRIKQFELDILGWQKEFSRYEGELHRKSLLVLRGLDRLKGPEVEKMTTDMEWGLRMAIKRYHYKVDALEKKFGGDFRYAQAIIYENLSLARQENLIALTQTEDELIFEKLIKYINLFDAHVKKQLKEGNYSVLMSALQLLALSKQKQYLGEPDDQANYVELLQAIRKFNRFRLTMEIDFAVASESIVATAQLSTPAEVFVSLGMNGCKYMLYATGTNYMNDEELKYYVPLIARGGVKNQKEEDDKWVRYGYTGPKELMTVFPPVTIGFCEDSPDSVSLSIIRFKAENYGDSAGKFPYAYTIDLGGYVNLLVLNQEGAEASVPEALEIAKGMMQVQQTSVSAYQSEILDRMATAYKRQILMRQKQIEFDKLAARNKVLLLFNANKSGEELFSAETNYTKSGEELSITKGIVRINVVHAPKPDDN